MGLLIVAEGDDQAEGLFVDLGMQEHAALIDEARKIGGMPLLRRMNNYYGDVLFEKDEIPDLISELERITEEKTRQTAGKILKICRQSFADENGMETIAD